MIHLHKDFIDQIPTHKFSLMFFKILKIDQRRGRPTTSESAKSCQFANATAWSITLGPGSFNKAYLLAIALLYLNSPFQEEKRISPLFFQ